ncbi:MAG: AAA family ATPase [Chloroflexi bacterium]|nr:AAA family ATPase [Chloroflexota bacterium]
MACPACGTENRPGSRFCDQCGAPQESPCPQCGQANRADARFCSECGTALAGAGPVATTAATGASASPAAERKLVSVLFCDLVGFTTFAEDRDPEAVRELLTRYFDETTAIVTRHGGTVEKFIGDAVMAVWGTPVAHEDDAERAVRAAIEVVDAVRGLQPDLQARAGVLSGEAAVTLNAQNQGMVAGDLVNTAARLQGVAEPGTVLVGEATMRATERSIVFEPIGEHSLKGKTAPVPAWRAVRVVAQRGGQGRGDALEAPFVGRDEELRQLKDALHAVGREQRPRLVSITGVGGIGKSRLLWELLKYIDGVEESIYWHRGRSPSYGDGVTFWALGEMIRRRAGLTESDDDEATRERIAATLTEFVPDEREREQIEPALLSVLGVGAAPAAGRDALFPAWRLFFERIAARGTTVLAFEDLHWADGGLLDFIDHVLDWSRGLPIMVVTLARPELFDRRPDWGSGRRHMTALALEPLHDDDMRKLLDGLVPGLPPDALAAIVGRAEGMPLYAVEMVRGLLADGLIERRGDAYAPTGDLGTLHVPDSLRSLIASRLDALDAPDRALVQDAAVLGHVFAAEALAAVHGTSVEELEPRLRSLVRRELFDFERDPASPEHGKYRFVQSLIREVAYGTLGRRERRERHLVVARHFEMVDDDELAGVLASHYLSARAASEPGPEADALTAQARLALRGAAERAAALGSPEQALSYLEQALEITSGAGDRAPLLDRAATAASAAARDATPFATAAIEAYVQLGDAAAANRARTRFGRNLLDASEIGRATEVLEAALDEAEGIDEPAALAAVLANLARAYFRGSQAERAIEAADRALLIAERLNLEAVVAEALVNKGAALSMLGRRREAVGLHRVALELIQKVGDRSSEIRIRNNLMSAISDDDPLGANQATEEALALARQVGDRAMYTWLAGNAAAAAVSQGGNWDRHAEQLEEVLEQATLRGDRMRTRLMLGLIQSHRGEFLDEIVPEVRALISDEKHPEQAFNVHMSEGMVALASHRPEDAYRHAISALELDTQAPEIPASLALTAATWTRDPDAVRAAAARLIAVPFAGALSAASRTWAEAAVRAVDGHHADAVAGFRDARERLRSLGQEFDAASLVVSALHLLPEEPEVRAWGAEIRPMLERLRARPMLERLEELLGTEPVSADTRPASDAQVPSERV